VGRCTCIRTIIGITLLFTCLQSAYANGDDIHLGGIFFLLLGGIVFLGGLIGVLYFLFRPEPDSSEEDDSK
jgi:hypothetical protein